MPEKEEDTESEENTESEEDTASGDLEEEAEDEAEEESDEETPAIPYKTRPVNFGNSDDED